MESIFKVGDVVRIRQWDDMAEEFGINKSGHIECPFTFTRMMKNLCGDEVTIREIEKFGANYRFYFEEDGDYIYYSFSEQMLEPIETSTISFDELKDVLEINNDC